MTKPFFFSNNNQCYNNINCKNSHMCFPCEENTQCTYQPNCPMNTICIPGPQGPIGETGPAGGLLNYADFYVITPPDNAATVAPGTDVSFPQNGPNSGAGYIYNRAKFI